MRKYKTLQLYSSAQLGSQPNVSSEEVRFEGNDGNREEEEVVR